MMNLRTILILSATNVLAAPLVGNELGRTDLPPLLCVYIILATSMWPLAILVWSLAKDGHI